MNIFSNIIRGGQLTLHALRMFRQVSYYLLLWGFLVFLIFFSLSMYDKTNSTMWGEYRDYQTANFLCQVMMCSKKVTVYVGKEPAVYTANSVINSAFFYTARDYIHKMAKEACIFSIKIAGSALLIVGIFFIWRGFKKTGEEFKRGARLSGFEKIKTAITNANKKEKYNAYQIAGMPYPYLAEMQHSFVIGANGTGKTILISQIVEQIRERGDKAIIYDKKGDYTKWFYNPKKDKILNPFDQRSESWSLLSEIENIVGIKQLSKAFIPEKENPGGEGKIWDEAGRLAFTEIVSKLYSQGEILTNREIVDRILKSTMKEVAKALKNTYGQAIVDPNSPRTASSVLFVIAAHFNSLKLTNSKPGESFSIRDWLLGDEQDSMLFLTSQENLSGELAPLQTAWMEIVIGAILSKPADSDKKTWVIIDELPAINKIPSLGNALATTRSYGGCFVLGMQNIAQLREVYGRNAAQNISSECNTRCIFQSNDSDTAKWMSDNIGDIEVSEFKEGLSYGANTIRDGVSVSKQDKVKPILLPSEILNMSRLNLILKMPDHPAVKAKVKHKKREAIVEPFIKNHEIVEDLKSAYDDVEEVSNEGEESGNKRGNKNSAGNAEGKKELASKNQNNQTII
jgi:type IV conjugative transfer system coupling protein TraD